MVDIVENYLPYQDNVRRRGAKISKVDVLVAHFTGNAVRYRKASDIKDYWLDEMSRNDYASAHTGIGVGGEIQQFIPFDEPAWHSGTHTPTEYIKRKLNSDGLDINYRSLSAELCFDNLDEFPPPVWDSAIKLFAFWCRTFNRDPFTDIITHYMVTGRKRLPQCPLQFYRNPDLFRLFILEVAGRV